MEIAVIGDSFTRGTEMGGFRAAQAWPALVQQQLRELDIDSKVSVGADRGSGYFNRGSKGTTFADQLPKVVTTETQLVLLFGSLNDGSVPADELASAVRETLVRVKDSALCATVLVIGPPWVGAEPTTGVLRTRDIVRGEANLAGLSFIDPIADMWFSGRPDLIGSDGIHPTDEGHRIMAGRIAPIVAHQLGVSPQ